MKSGSLLPLVLALAGMIVSTGCATSTLQVRSQPKEATILIDGQPEGTGLASKVVNSYGFLWMPESMEIRLRKDGNESEAVLLKREKIIPYLEMLGDTSIMIALGGLSIAYGTLGGNFGGGIVNTVLGSLLIGEAFILPAIGGYGFRSGTSPLKKGGAVSYEVRVDTVVGSVESIKSGVSDAEKKESCDLQKQAMKKKISALVNTSAQALSIECKSIQSQLTQYTSKCEFLSGRIDAPMCK